MEIIKAEGLSFGYAKDIILDEIDLSVNSGDFTVISGANGTGKSTLFKLLLNEFSPSDGTIRWFGQDIKSFKAWNKIGYVAQHNILMGNSFPATVEEVVKASLYSEIGFLRFANKKHTEKTMKYLELVGMRDFAKSMVGELSGGQQQKVMIARALVCEPEILLLDEPTTGVDSKSTEELYNILGRLNKTDKLTILMILHDFSGVSQYLSNVFSVKNNKLFAVELEQAPHCRFCYANKNNR